MTEGEFRKKLMDEGFNGPIIFKATAGPVVAMHRHDESILWMLLEGEFTMNTENGEKYYTTIHSHFERLQRAWLFC